MIVDVPIHGSGILVLNQKTSDYATDHASNQCSTVTGRTDGRSLGRRRGWRHPGPDGGPGVVDGGGGDGLGGAADDSRCRHDLVKHSLRLGQDALRDVVRIAGVGAVAAVA